MKPASQRVGGRLFYLDGSGDAWFTSREFFSLGERLLMPRMFITIALALTAVPALAQDGGVAPISPLTPTASTDAEAMRRDLDAARREVKEMREEMRAQLIDQAPRIGAGGARIAFVHPKSGHGVLTELREGPKPPSRAPSRQ